MTEKQTPSNRDDFANEAFRRAKARFGIEGVSDDRGHISVGKVVTAAAGLAVVVGGVAGLNKVIDSQNNAPQPMDNGVALAKVHMPSVNELTLEKDANVRNKPFAPLDPGDTGNTVGTYSGQEVTIVTPGGVDAYVNQDGTWYGVPVKDLPESVRAELDTKKLSQDKDQEVWVSQQKASPVTTVIGDVATPSDNPSDPTNLAGLNH